MYTGLEHSFTSLNHTYMFISKCPHPRLTRFSNPGLDEIQMSPPCAMALVSGLGWNFGRGLENFLSLEVSKTGPEFSIQGSIHAHSAWRRFWPNIQAWVWKACQPWMWISKLESCFIKAWMKISRLGWRYPSLITNFIYYSPSNGGGFGVLGFIFILVVTSTTSIFVWHIL